MTIWTLVAMRSGLPSVELQSAGVDAVAVARGGRAVVEDVAEMAAASLAGHLGAVHAVAGVGVQLDVRPVGRLGEAGPAGPRVELGAGIEQLRPASGTPVDAVLVVVPEGAGEGPLGPGLPEHLVLLGGQSSAPFLVGLGKFGLHGSFLPRTER